MQQSFIMAVETGGGKKVLKLTFAVYITIAAVSDPSILEPSQCFYQNNSSDRWRDGRQVALH